MRETLVAIGAHARVDFTCRLVVPDPCIVVARVFAGNVTSVVADRIANMIAMHCPEKQHVPSSRSSLH